MISVNFRASVAVAAMLALGACGGGSGGPGRTPRPPAAPTPTPPPAPTPTPTPPTTFDTGEYRASIGPTSMRALTAYDRGFSGQGVMIGIVDSGIDLQSVEFDNRISPLSRDFAGNGSADDVGGHGTAVAFTAAGRRNGVGTHGAAPQATVLALRTDEPGSCAGADGCQHPDDAIARAVDHAVASGARVINMSLGGSPMSSGLTQAVSRATAAGVVLVISAGNDSEANPDQFAAIATTSAARGQVIIAGSVGVGDLISDFSNRAGTGRQAYLAAVGEGVRAPNENSEPFIWSGTSFAAPQISGAVALLAQAFPNLTGAQIVQLLYTSARDAGPSGTDAIYGRGILDLTRAFEPQGGTSNASTGGAISSGVNGVLGAPMGDASQGSLGAVVLDGFDRAFALELGQSIARAAPSPRFVRSLEGRRITQAGALGPASIALTVASGRDRSNVERLRLANADAVAARTLAGYVAQRLSGADTVALGFGETGTSLGALLKGRAEPAFLVAGDPTRSAGFDAAPDVAFAWRRMVGPVGVTASVERGDALSRRADALAGLRDPWARDPYDRVSLGLDRRWGAFGLSLTGSWMRESETVLGARFSPGVGAANATSWFADMRAGGELGGGWQVSGSMRQGWTLAETRGGVGGGGLIRTAGYALELAHDGGFGLRLSQPLRVESGAIGVLLASEYDYASGVTASSLQRINLTPEGREIALEARYGLALGDGWMDANLFWRRDPGHFAALPDDMGAALRFTIGL
ncbi:peptidase S8 [Sphingomonas gilva]|uniref:Peptidase S8 n=1 Tax=Sphingomonas gilva TaxID=2305907 RepID=A0A396RNG0_9SPHN|nr:S8 family peptidase [Sphingomonas gilva]RHW18000.1 peptidase S8 [Sphingomonas gilva]